MDKNSRWIAQASSIEDANNNWGSVMHAVLSGEELPRNPDWRLTLPDAFLMWIHPSVLEKAKSACGWTHEFFAMYYDNEKRGMVYVGWYGRNREAGALAIKPVVEALDEWRRGSRKDSTCL